MIADFLDSIKSVHQEFSQDTTGATAIEYGLIAAGIGVVIIG